MATLNLDLRKVALDITHKAGHDVVGFDALFEMLQDEVQNQDGNVPPDVAFASGLEGDTLGLIYAAAQWTLVKAKQATEALVLHVLIDQTYGWLKGNNPRWLTLEDLHIYAERIAKAVADVLNKNKEK